MLVLLSWLQEYVDVPWPAHELAERMTNLGQKVESIRRFGADVSGVVVGRIEGSGSHPTKDHLLVCHVNIGDRDISVVSGAPNLEPGIKVPVALPGARVVGIDGPVAVAEFHGVKSYGMLCAEDELGISDDHSGVMVLPEDTPLGSDVAQLLYLGDAVIEFEIHPNRPDCLSVIGLAREVAALTGGTVRVPKPEIAKTGEPVTSLAKVTVEDSDLCPRFCARVIRGVRVGPSPLWMQQRLRAAGVRPINNVVDITNYVMLEMGQPLHAYDLSLLRGRQIIVRRAKPDEILVTLDGQERRLDPEMLVIADAEGAVGIAGVMGGENTEIRPETTDVLLEAANFDNISVRKTSRKLGLRSEASGRFEKGLDPHLPPAAADRAAELLCRLCGGTVASGMIDVHGDLESSRVVNLRPQRVNKLLGTTMSVSEIAEHLRRLGLESEEGADQTLHVSIPSYRRDIELEEDLIEEVARVHGYDAIPATLPQETASVGAQSQEMRLLDQLRAVCIGAGLYETITYGFISPRHFDLLRFPPDDDRRRAVRILNPLTEDQSVMRTTLMPNLMEALSRNASRQNGVVHLFEIGNVFFPKEWPVTSQPEERRTLGIAMMGSPVSAWGKHEIDFFTLKGILEVIAKTLSIDLSVRAAVCAGLHPGRAAEIVWKDRVVGFLGEVHPLVQQVYDLPERAFYLELDLEVLEDAGGPPQAVSLPRYPAVFRDLALLVPVEMPAERVVEIIRQEGGSVLDDVKLFDIYQGRQVPDGYRSLAYSCSFRAADRTLTDEEINEVVERIKKALASENVSLRG
ncbi:MAG: phenylalanine--tRNA ligase subunit beta [Firmicutes bacterium]|jgi:phenylalanyl-tRNA synthetase beta chain|nr:phenylalanine--tRNA ligase subunit beta [Bacillota bacterium]